MMKSWFSFLIDQMYFSLYHFYILSRSGMGFYDRDRYFSPRAAGPRAEIVIEVVKSHSRPAKYIEIAFQQKIDSRSTVFVSFAQFSII